MGGRKSGYTYDQVIYTCPSYKSSHCSLGHFSCYCVCKRTHTHIHTCMHTHTCTHTFIRACLSPGHPEMCVSHTLCQFNNVLRMIRYNAQASSLVFLGVSLLYHSLWIGLLFILLSITLYFIKGVGVSFKHDSDEFRPQRVVEMLGSLRFWNGDLRLSGRRLLGNFFQYFFLVL